MDKEQKIEAVKMIEITRPKIIEQVPQKEIEELIASDLAAIEEYTNNIAIRQARIEQYQNLLDNQK